MRPRGAHLRIGTRSSTLAVWQTERVRALLRQHGFETERVEIKTTGDLTPDVPLARIGSRALFTKQIDDALLEGHIDLAVHSLKDLPTQLPAGITIAAVGDREDPRDALVGRGPIRWAELQKGAAIATSSLRRRAQILNLRPDLIVVDIRGNVDSRLTKLDARPDWTGTILAVAGLVRLGLTQRIGERLPAEVMLPAPGQGALAVTVRTDDAKVQVAVRRAVHHEASAIPVAAERAFLRRLEGGCQVPVAAYAESGEGPHSIRLWGRIVSVGGEKAVSGHETGLAPTESAADQLGVMLAERLLSQGAAAILTEVRSAVVPAVTEP
ncbi:MAG TPA: hydroxymethylbilane synthase [Gemmatimonadales bacterium]|nr:hydroxymethylbilane synthase [Gemmatimonadales bacterium]